MLVLVHNLCLGYTIDDLVSLFDELLFNPAYNGIYNAVATEHATNYSFSKQLAHALHRPFFMPLVPAFYFEMDVW